jgi:hypothetical protein
MPHIHKDLCQMSLGTVTVRSYGRYDINGFRFRSTKFESTHPLVATTNTGVVCTTKDDQESHNKYSSFEAYKTT